MKKVLVTGVSGFLGSHIAIEGIRRGYSIRGTVRSPEKISGVQAIFEKQKPGIVPEIFLADLLQEEGWIKATHGCDAVMHVASPFLLELPKHEDELIRPAVEGVRNVLAACRRNQVSRIVQTSSVAAIVFGHEAERNNFDETDWTNPEGKNVSPYYKSKFLAEKEFWHIGKMNPELQLTSICPGLVFGPLLNQDTGTSVEILHRMLKGKYPGVPRLGYPCVDVRDVAKLHWDALENPASIGLRLPAVSGSLWFYEIAEILKQCFPAYSSKVSAWELPDWFVRIYAIFEKSAKMILPELGFRPELSIGVSQKFHFNPRPVKDSIHDSAKSIIELGLL